MHSVIQSGVTVFMKTVTAVSSTSAQDNVHSHVWFLWPSCVRPSRVCYCSTTSMSSQHPSSGPGARRAVGGLLSKEIFKLDVETKQCTQITTSGTRPRARIGHAMASIGGHLWVHGGSTESGEGAACYTWHGACNIQCLGLLF